MDAYFDEERIERFINKHNWELIPYGDVLYYLRQIGGTHKTRTFELEPEVAEKYLKLKTPT